ncbi:MAG: flavodoxin domain-containing protein [Chloroflexales bacterium]|nr:flavodoxin domain-containing protein [Chloroflexales bacterium]
MYILIAIASRHGSTREIAEALAKELCVAGHSVEVQTIDENTAIETPDAVVIGSAIYMGGWLPEAREFVERSWLRLASVPTWLFSSGPLGHDDPQPQGNPAQLDELLATTGAREHRVFVGKLDKQRLHMGERLITAMVKAPEGDFRDWDAIRAWAHEIAAALALVSASSNDLLSGDACA